jgi:hypothetical protein
MPSLTDQGVLDALSDSDQVSLTCKRALIQVDALASATLEKVLSDAQTITVHPADCTASNAAYVTKRALGTLDGITLKVVSKNPGPPMVVGNPWLGWYKENPLVLRGPDGPNGQMTWTMDVPTAYFLGHVVIGEMNHTLARSFWVRLITRGEQDLFGSLLDVETWWKAGVLPANFDAIMEANPLHRALLSGLALHCARKRLENLNGRHMFVYLDGLWMDDDVACMLAPQLVKVYGNIHELVLKKNKFGTRGCAALFDVPRGAVDKRWPILRKLDLESVRIGAAGYPPLFSAMKNGHMPALTSLNLCKTGLEDIGMRTLLEALPSVPALEVLNVADNRFGRYGLEPLKRLPPKQIVLPKLRILYMASQPACRMEPAGWRVLAQAIMDNCFPQLSSFEHGTPYKWLTYAVSANCRRRDWLAAERHFRKEFCK